MGSRCDILNVEYLSVFVKGSTLRKISAFAIVFQGICSHTAIQTVWLFVLLSLHCRLRPILWVSVSYITRISRKKQDIKAPDTTAIHSLISGDNTGSCKRDSCFNGKCPSGTPACSCNNGKHPSLPTSAPMPHNGKWPSNKKRLWKSLHNRYNENCPSVYRFLTN